MTMIRVMVVDDNPDFLIWATDTIAMTNGVTLAYSTTDPLKALGKIEQMDIDLLIVDMDMPRLSGLDLLAQLKRLIQPPIGGRLPLKVIVCSAHPQYAIDTYEYNVTHFLQKPVAFIRYIEALDRVRDELSLSPSINNLKKTNDVLLIESDRGTKVQRVDIADIVYLEAQDSITLLRLSPTMSIVVKESLAKVFQRLPKDKFVRVHKGFIIGLDYYEGEEGNYIKMRGFSTRIPKGNKLLYKAFWKWKDDNKMKG